MRGSKYVHSDTSKVFNQVVKILKGGKKVLFSGTPCQVAQMKKMAFNNRQNLYTFEILCHGTPSLSMFQNAIEFWNLRLKGKPIKTIKVCDWFSNEFLKDFNILNVISKIPLLLVLTRP